MVAKLLLQNDNNEQIWCVRLEEKRILESTWTTVYVAWLRLLLTELVMLSNVRKSNQQAGSNWGWKRLHQNINTTHSKFGYSQPKKISPTQSVGVP